MRFQPRRTRPSCSRCFVPNSASVYPETIEAAVVADEWLVKDDCPLIDTRPWKLRPEVVTPDPRLVLAGDGIRCDLPVALMERAATTGFLAANQLLAEWDLQGHDIWTVPMQGRHHIVAPARRLLTRNRRPLIGAAGGPQISLVPASTNGTHPNQRSSDQGSWMERGRAERQGRSG